ncbi:ABC transporter ATP-binding protein [Paenibacillus sp. L3-i20]|uniref:ABC transporter ATP-binding protein n=1 Tax=Paenibacillus sp. L3-i20 TaxID=2905833 RepID=UPI001EDFC817|nr:ATP-binding cassette domain-containing protein [Paenibacillus sp. L3-i20]GKU78282.1 hypothetical protein L3i20_v226790 [Paenibacillus sp. L3-i20]
MKKVLVAKDLVKHYGQGKQCLTTVNNVSLHIGEGECLGLVGESGSGKSTLAKVLLALEVPDEGDVWLNGQSLFSIRGAHLRNLRQYIQIVFQNCNASLNDRLPIWRSIMEPLDNFREACPPFLSDVRHSRRATAERLLEMVGMQSYYMDRYPHELSGGQRQRVAIARGISVCPQLLVCDEPTASLDVTIQAQILQLLKQLQRELSMSCLFISHDIAAVHGICDRMIVMKDGAIIDQFRRDEIWNDDRNPYTTKLIKAAR